MTKQEILEFIKTKKLAVISTSSLNGIPEAALIGFGETDDFELVFGTYRTSRKYQNLKVNNKVAFVIGWDNELVTVQLEGWAFELGPDELEKYVSLYHKKSPKAVEYRMRPEQTYWRVKPNWVRYTDIKKKDEDVIEYTF